MKILNVATIIISATYCAIAVANVHADKAAGICAAYLTLAKKPTAEKALEKAENKELALKYGRKWIKAIDRRDSDIASITSNADATCRAIGISP